MPDAYILAGMRTPIGKFMGALQGLPAPELGAIAITAALVHAETDPNTVDEVIMGNVLSAAVGQAPARQAALQAGLPTSVPAVTINKVCGSGLKAVMLADQAIRAGDAETIVAGGMENMSRAPHLLPQSRSGWKLGDVLAKDAMLLDGLWCAFEDCHMGSHAESTARKYEISREQQDRYAAESQRRATEAITSGAFTDEIVPVTITDRRSETTVTADEGPRAETTVEKLAQLKTAFDQNGSVTAGNAAMISDGAAAVVVASREVAEQSDAPWKARIVASHTSGTAPGDLFIAPVSAVQGVLKKANLTLDDIDLFEINEAFAAQMLACLKLLDLDSERVNVHGGAIALGHPIGASGARVLVTLLSAMKQRGLQRGLASLCLGGGNAVAMIVEFED